MACAGHIYFSAFQKNRFKRKNIPILGYKGYIPKFINLVGKTKEVILDEVFGFEFMKKDKKNENPLDNLGLKEFKRMFRIKMKGFNTNNFNFINVFDLMFTVNKVTKNEIILNQNNISEILSQYSDPEIFKSLLNHSFPDKKAKDVHVDFDVIEKDINENKK